MTDKRMETEGERIEKERLVNERTGVSAEGEFAFAVAGGRGEGGDLRD
jgi:hypothetical protein